MPKIELICPYCNSVSILEIKDFYADPHLNRAETFTCSICKKPFVYRLVATVEIAKITWPNDQLQSTN